MYIAELLAAAVFLLAMLTYGVWALIAPAQAMDWFERHLVAYKLLDFGPSDDPWNKAGTRTFGAFSSAFALLVLSFVIHAIIVAL